MDFIQELKKLGACSGGVEWAGTQSSVQEMWDNCERGDWMLWLCGKLSGEVGSDSRKKLVWTACKCARLALPYISNKEKRPRIAIETAEKYCEGSATLEDVRSAAADAADAAYAAAAYAPSASAYAYAASSASAAASAATNASAAANASAAYADAAYAPFADAEQQRILKKCAGIVRECYPVCPLEERE